MIEIILLLMVAVILSSWALLTIVTITIADLRTIALERSLRRYPHARKWRGVSRLKKQLDFYGDKHTVPRHTIRFALARFQANPSLRFVELLPQLMFPRTTKQFFDTYRTIALAPFVRFRSVMNIRSPHQHWLLLARPNIGRTRREYAYPAAIWLLTVLNATLLAYISFIAALGEAQYLLGYLSVFTLWLAWSICTYPDLTISHKITYLLLAPASLGYLLWRVIANLFAPLQQLCRAALRRRSMLS